MKNLKIKSLLAAAALVCQSAFGLADDLQGRTYFFLPNVHHSTKPLTLVSRLDRMEKGDDAVGLRVSGWAAYQQALCTRSADELAKGLMNGTSNILKFYGAGVDASKGDVALRQVFLPASAGAVVTNYELAQSATVALKVEHRRVAGGVDLCYAADKFYEGLWLGAGVSFAWERNKLTPTATNTSTAAHATLTDPAAALTALLAGSALPGTVFQQNATLSALKIGNGTVRSRATVNDVCLVAGLRVVDNETAELNLAVVGLLPGAQGRKTEFLFDANPGERQYKLGLKGCALLKLVCEEEYKIDLHAGACWKYAFKKSNENYVPQLKGKPGAQYMLASRGNVAAALVPAANLLDTLTVTVDGASELDAWLALAMEKGCFGGSIGYNLGWIQEKKLVVDGLPAEKAYAANAYAGTTAVAGTIVLNTPAGANNQVDGTAVTLADFVDKETAKLMHCVSAEANWTFTSWDYPLTVGAGVSYVIARDRVNTPEYLTVGVRGGVSF